MSQKSIEFNKSKIKEYEKGVKTLIFPVDMTLAQIATVNMMDRESPDVFEFLSDIGVEFNLRVGDKKVFIQEDHLSINAKTEYVADYNNENWVSDNTFRAETMTKKQSRYSLKEILSIKLIKLNDLEEQYKCQLKEDEYGKTYDLNDYMFVVEYK